MILITLRNRIAMVGIFGLAVIFPMYGAIAQAPADSFFTGIIEQCNPRMVKVFGAGAGRVEGFATGIVISGDGLILTTQGVYLDGSRVRVILADGSEYQATLLRRDRVTQLALLKIQAETPDYFELMAEPLGEKGDWVVALTNAFKVADKEEPLSATLGVISLRTFMEARLNQRDVAYKGDLVLIDAITSNPGAGGGAVVTVDAGLVGIVGKIINSSETNTRLNYAVPNHVLYEFVNSEPVAAQMESVEPPAHQPAELGIVPFKLGGRNSPVYIDRVKRGTPAFKARLKTDDMIVALAGENVGNLKEYQAKLDTLRPGEEIIIIVKRGTDFLRIPITPVERD